MNKKKIPFKSVKREGLNTKQRYNYYTSFVSEKKIMSLETSILLKQKDKYDLYYLVEDQWNQRFLSIDYYDLYSPSGFKYAFRLIL